MVGTAGRTRRSWAPAARSSSARGRRRGSTMVVTPSRRSRSATEPGGGDGAGDRIGAGPARGASRRRRRARATERTGAEASGPTKTSRSAPGVAAEVDVRTVAPPARRWSSRPASSGSAVSRTANVAPHRRGGRRGLARRRRPGRPPSRPVRTIDRGGPVERDRGGDRGRRMAGRSGSEGGSGTGPAQSRFTSAASARGSTSAPTRARRRPWARPICQLTSSMRSPSAGSTSATTVVRTSATACSARATASGIEGEDEVGAERGDRRRVGRDRSGEQGAVGAVVHGQAGLDVEAEQRVGERGADRGPRRVGPARQQQHDRAPAERWPGGVAGRRRFGIGGRGIERRRAGIEPQRSVRRRVAEADGAVVDDVLDARREQGGTGHLGVVHHRRRGRRGRRRPDRPW